MMMLYNELNSFIENLKAYDDLKNCSVIRAYPYIIQPTNLKNPVIACSLGEINSDNVEYGGAVIYGSYQIIATVFVPFKNGINNMPSYIEAVLKAQAQTYPSKISVSQIEKKEDLKCLRVKLCFTYSGEIDLEINNNE